MRNGCGASAQRRGGGGGVSLAASERVEISSMAHSSTLSNAVLESVELGSGGDDPTIPPPLVSTGVILQGNILHGNPGNILQGNILHGNGEG
jgi:hypothetical protein